MWKFAKKPDGGEVERSATPTSLMGIYCLHILLNHVQQRDEAAKLAKERIPAENPERGALIALILELLIERCFTRPPDDATIRRFLDYIFAGVQDSSRPDPDLSGRLVRVALSPDGIPDLSSPLDGKVITARVAISALIAHHYGIQENEMAGIVAGAEGRAASLGLSLTSE